MPRQLLRIRYLYNYPLHRVLFLLQRSLQEGGSAVTSFEAELAAAAEQTAAAQRTAALRCFARYVAATRRACMWHAVRRWVSAAGTPRAAVARIRCLVLSGCAAKCCDRVRGVMALIVCILCTAAAERAGIILDIAMVHTDQRTAAARLCLLWSHHWHKRLSR
jgi:hypothetical protein